MFPVQFISFCLTNPAFSFHTFNRVRSNLDLFFLQSPQNYLSGVTLPPSQKLDITVFDLDVPPLKKKKKKSLLKAQTFKIKGWKTSSNLGQTLSQRRLQLISSGSCGSLLAQEVKTNGYSSAPSLLASSHPHLI